MITQLFEIAIAVRDVDTAAKKYSDVLGVQPISIKAEHFPVPGLRGVVFPVGNRVVVSLLASEEPNTALAKFINARGEGVFLVAFEVTDIEQEMRRLAEQGVAFVNDKPLPYTFGWISFAHPKSMHGVQIAIAQHKPGYYEEFIQGSTGQQ